MSFMVIQEDKTKKDGRRNAKKDLKNRKVVDGQKKKEQDRLNRKEKKNN